LLDGTGANFPATRPLSSACFSSFGDLSSFASACSLSLSLALTIHRQAHRRVQCIRPLTTACSFSYSFGDCVAVASACRLLSFSFASACAVSSSLSVACPCCFHFVHRLLSYSFDSTCSHNSSPSYRCIRPVISACSFSSPFSECTAVASCLSGICSLSLSLSPGLTLHRHTHRQ
jgi:hypothetical protein